MGICCCGSDGVPSTREDCAEIGCTYFEDSEVAPCLSSNGGPCALLSALHDHVAAKSGTDPVVMLAAGGTFTALQDLRDEILDRSRFGIELLARYREHAPRAMEIISSDQQELMEETLGVFLTGASFGMAILRHHHGRRGQALGPRRFTKETYDRGRAVLQRFREVSASQGEEERFREPLEFVEREIEFFVGKTPGEARRRLMEEQ